MSHVLLQHPETMEIEKVHTGFSWSYLFFGFFVLLYRKEFVWAILLILSTLPMFWIPAWILPMIVVHIAVAFLCNEWNLNQLKKQGWKPVKLQQ